jgi:ABC-type multidrug transport system ATPase subunit
MSAAKDYSSTDLCLAFKDLSASQIVPPKPLLRNVSGFVAKGGITAVFGPSSAGKSLLLQTLSARVQSLSITGSVFLNGLHIDPSSNQNSVSYVSQDTMLIGDLTAREMIRNAAYMKTKKPAKYIEESVTTVLKDFGLDHVADTYIGTIFRSGLSGGQKRRVDVAVELVSAPSLLLLDEPTSGLDGSIAFDVLSSIRNSVKARPASNALSVMLSIHQPNSRILELFDHILVLGKTGMTFFGTVQESVLHFTRIGYAPPPKYTPTDYYLNITDTSFNQNKFDFVGAFNSSEKYLDLLALVDLVESRGQLEQLMLTMGAAEASRKSPQSVGDSGESTEDSLDTLVHRKDMHTSIWTQMRVLMTRDFTIAARDPTMYYLQVAMVLMFGFLIGAVFFQLKYRINESMTYIPSALLWIVLMTIYIQVFKVYHMNKANQRFAHEHTNGSYSVPAYWWADLLTVSTLLVFYLPGAAIAYFMAGLPGKAFPFLMLLFWMVRFPAVPPSNITFVSL